MTFLTFILAAVIGLVPAPVEYSPNTCHTSFKKAVASLEPWQREEAYRLTIKGKKVKIEALTDEGRFRASMSLEQLRALGELPQGTIFDYPRLRHRGLMIDESRSFHGLDFLKKQVDAMALLKLNVLHLHLDDSAGWRIESESYPGLPSADGLYYTKEQLRELVAYAAERYISVIPEVEMPGHSREVGQAYPETVCAPGSWDLCPGSEATYRLLESVLEEVMEVFPSELIHIGGDEASMENWGSCPRCRALMEREGYTSVKELQGYLVRRIEAFLRARGRRIIGWDEILDTGIPDGAVVQSWRGVSGGLKASALGHDVIMSPNSHLYLDYYQDLIRKEPRAVGELTSLRWVYGYEPLAEGMAPERLLGIQGNLWTELVPTAEHAEYMLYPRLFAIAETAWSPSSAKEWENFRLRARALMDVFRALGYNTFDMDTESDLARSGYRTFGEYEASGKK